MKGNHCGHCSITYSPFGSSAPPLFMINCQLSPRGLNWQVNQTDHPPGGICGTDDEAQSSLISALTLVHVGNHCPRDSCSVAGSSPRLCLCYSFCIDMGAWSEKHAQRAVQPQCGGGATCAGRRMSRWSRLRGNSQEISPRFTMCFSPTEWCEIKHVKWNTSSGGMGFTSMQEASAPSRVEACTFVSVNPPTQEYTHAAWPYGNLQLCDARRKNKEPQ